MISQYLRLKKYKLKTSSIGAKLQNHIFFEQIQEQIQLGITLNIIYSELFHTFAWNKISLDFVEVHLRQHLSDRHFARLILGQAVHHAFRYIEASRPLADTFEWEKASKMLFVK